MKKLLFIVTMIMSICVVEMSIVGENRQIYDKIQTFMRAIDPDLNVMLINMPYQENKEEDLSTFKQILFEEAKERNLVILYTDFNSNLENYNLYLSLPNVDLMDQIFERLAVGYKTPPNIDKDWEISLLSSSKSGRLYFLASQLPDGYQNIQFKPLDENMKKNIGVAELNTTQVMGNARELESLEQTLNEKTTISALFSQTHMSSNPLPSIPLSVYVSSLFVFSVFIIVYLQMIAKQSRLISIKLLFGASPFDIIKETFISLSLQLLLTYIVTTVFYSLVRIQEVNHLSVMILKPLTVSLMLFSLVICIMLMISFLWIRFVVNTQDIKYKTRLNNILYIALTVKLIAFIILTPMLINEIVEFRQNYDDYNYISKVEELKSFSFMRTQKTIDFSFERSKQFKKILTEEKALFFAEKGVVLPVLKDSVFYLEVNDAYLEKYYPIEVPKSGNILIVKKGTQQNSVDIVYQNTNIDEIVYVDRIPKLMNTSYLTFKGATLRRPQGYYDNRDLIYLNRDSETLIEDFFMIQEDTEGSVIKLQDILNKNNLEDYAYIESLSSSVNRRVVEVQMFAKVAFTHIVLISLTLIVLTLLAIYIFAKKFRKRITISTLHGFSMRDKLKLWYTSSMSFTVIFLTYLMYKYQISDLIDKEWTVKRGHPFIIAIMFILFEAISIYVCTSRLSKSNIKLKGGE